MRDSWVIGVVSVIGLLVMAALVWQLRDRVLTGTNDFLQLYCGARLVGTPDLYNPARIRQVQEQALGLSPQDTSADWPGAGLLYSRLPYYAAFLWPLGRLPYQKAYHIWEFLAVAAAAVFVCMWRCPSAGVTLMFSSFFLPLFHSLIMGQDLTFILLLVAISLWCEKSGRSFTAGLVLSLCAAKFHLFLMVPILLVAQKRWRFAWGLAAGGAVLVAVSFAVAGPFWPKAYYAVLTNANIHPATGHMPNLHGLLGSGTSIRFVEWLGAAMVAVAVWVVARRTTLEYSLAATLAGGLLVSFHSYMQDCSVLLPSALIVLSTTSLPPLRWLSLLLLTPIGYLLLLTSAKLATITQLAIVLFVLLMAVEAWRQSRFPKPILSTTEPMAAV